MQTFHFDMLQEANLSTKVTMGYNNFLVQCTLLKVLDVKVVQIQTHKGWNKVNCFKFFFSALQRINKTNPNVFHINKRFGVSKSIHSSPFQWLK